MTTLEGTKESKLNTFNCKSIKIDAFSWGAEDNKKWGTTSFIKINDGSNVRPNGRGHGIVIIDPITLNIENSFVIDTWGDMSRAHDELYHCLQGFTTLEKEYIIVITISDSGFDTKYQSGKSDTILRDKLGSWCLPLFRESYVFIGSTKGRKVWTLSQSKPKGKGPTHVVKTIYFR